MERYFLILLTCILCGCSDNSGSEFKTDLPISENELLFKKGDCLMFKLDSANYGAAVVIEFSKDSGGIWYGLVFTNYESINKPDTAIIKAGKFMGRKVSNSLWSRSYIRLLDGEHIHTNMILNEKPFSKFGNLTLTKEAKLGAYGASDKFSDFVLAFRNNQESRLSPPDEHRDYFDYSRNENFRPDEYFEAKDFLKK